MKIHKQIIVLICLFSFSGWQLNAQQIDFELHYNDAASLYEVYAIPDSSNSLFFVGGGSQLSLVLPQDLADAPLQINTVAGGFWTDNSQIYNPESDHIHDFHGIATNGAMVNFEKEIPLLLFTFELPGGVCRSDIRLFENTSDPASQSIGMNYADFKNFFANVFDPLKNNWKKNDNFMASSCIHAPAIESELLTIEENSSETICISIDDPNIGDSFQAQLCSNGNGFSELKVENDQLCLTYTPSNGYVGSEDVCIEVCDQTGLCNSAMISVAVVPLVTHSTFYAYADECRNMLDWTVHNPAAFLYYELQRSDDGQNFELLDLYESDDQLDNQLFDYEDNSISRDHFYRLKLVLVDDSEKYSETVFVRSECDPEVILPETYTTFSAFANDCQNEVDWTVHRPIGCSHYELQRSNDGRNFELLDQFESNNQLANQSFHFLDGDIKTDHYYRLKLVYVDGSERYSEEAFVSSGCDINGGLSIYPNPVSEANPLLNIKFFAETENVNIIISDVLGRTVRRINLEMELGINTIRMEVADLPAGSYFLLIEGKNENAKSFTKIDERF